MGRIEKDFEERIAENKMKSGVYQFLVGCFAALGSFLFGYDL